MRNAIVSLLLISLMMVLASCASSNVSRDAAANVDTGFDNAKKMGSNLSSGDVVESWQNSKQASKGAILGGATGALVGGAATSTVGVIPGAMAGMVFGASYGAYIDSQTSVSDQLTNRGATIVEIGDHIMLAIPSERLFTGMTDTIKPQAYSTLDLATAYINSFTKTTVKVSAYTDDIGEKDVNLALSQQQARKVVKYLEASGVNARLLYGEGYGGTNLVEKNISDWGRSDNYRIEITLEKLDV